ncbi:hypothetical protein [Nocardia sp. NPDC059195]|uniref:hypothetical protein n=1 Tax=Nocardia sp. NPDC059195 TaxID=3346765 RepID=UPI0036AA3BD3
MEVKAPYDRRFHDAADELGGALTPDRDIWRFARADEDRVRQLCSEIFSGSATQLPPPNAGASNRTDCMTAEPLGQQPISIHQQRSDLLDRLETLLDEVAEVHTALRSLTKKR